MKRWTAAGLALTIAVLSPGTGAYNAAAQTAARAGASGASTRLALPAAPLAAPAGLTASPLSTLPGASLTLPQVSLPTVRPSPAAAATAASLSNPLPLAGEGRVRVGEAAPASLPHPNPLPQAGEGAIRETAGRQAVAGEVSSAIRSVAPLAETASRGSVGEARAAGLALEDILTRRASRRDADLVPVGRAWTSSLFGNGLSRLRPASEAKPAAEVDVPAAKQAKRSWRAAFGPVVRAALTFKTAALATALAIALHASASFAQLPFPTQFPIPAQTEMPVKRDEAVAPALQVAQAAPAPQAAPAADTVVAPAAVVQPAPVSVEAVVTGQGVTIGLPMTLTVTVRNLSGVPLTVPSVRGAIEDALPYTLEIRGQDDGAPLTLAAGETKVLTFAVVPFDAGKIVLEGAELAFPTADPEKPLIVKIPAATFEVASVLTPDWKEKGFKDLAEIRRVELPALAWLLALPLAGLALLGAERLLSARRRGRDPLVHNIPALDAAKTRLARLEAGASTMDAREFHGETLALVDRLLSDLRGLPRRERAMATLLADAKDKYTPGQLTVARTVVAGAEAVVYGPKDVDTPELRRRALVALRELIADLSPAPTPETAPPTTPLAGFGALLGGLTLGFAQPWALLLAVPVAAWAFHKWRAKKTEAWVSPAAANAPAKGTLRARLSWIPSFLRAATIGLVLLALSGPQIGVKRTETYVPSTDTMIASDISGSMSGERLEGLKRAVKDYLIEQRRGTQNRVGVVTFSDEAYLAVSLTTDYDALISRVKETQTEGSTAVGKGMMTAISHFLELNIMQMDASNPDVAEMRKLVLANDLAGALTYAKAKPGLMDKVLQPEKTKIVVIFTDGESNSGIKPDEAAKIAKQLGIKVYTVGIQIGGGETALKEVAAITGGLYFRADDADGMRNALLDISRLEKSPALVRAQVAVNDLTTPLALLALLALLMEVGLVSTRLRSLPALMLAGLIGMNGVTVPENWTGSAANAVPVQSQVIQTSLAERLPLTGVPKDLAEGNALYLQGRYGDAVKRYSEALESHPDVPELYFNLGNAYLRSGDVERAARAYAKFLELTKDPKAASEAIYNLGNAAVMAKDAEKAVELYREALRKDPTNASAKWNLEVLNRLMEEQQKDQQDGKDQQKKKQKGKKGEKKKGEKGEKGEKGDQKGEPGDEEGEEGDEPGKDGKPSDKQGKDGKPGEPKPGDAKPTPGEREKGVDGLIEEQGKTEKEGQEAQRGAVPRKGSGVWGFSLAGLGTAAAGFQAPLWLGIGLVALPIVAGLVIWAVNKKIASARKLAPAEAPKDLKSWKGKGRFWTKFSMILAATLGLALAAGDPIFGSKDTRLNFGGKDVIVTSDVSASTLYAEDGRGARVQKELSEFVTKMQGTDRIGLVVFAGKPRTASPLSQDYGTFDFKVSRLEREARGLSGGSDLASAIEHSVKVFEGAKKVGDRQRILIVVSDGEIFDQDLAKAVAAARKAGVTIFAIGVGDPAGTRIALPKADGTGTEFLIDEKTGQPALSKLYEAPLQKLASETGGAYFRSSEKVSMSDILGKVSEMSKGEETDAIKTPRGISFVFLTPALLLLLLEAFLPGVPLLRGRRQRASAPAPTPSPKPVSGEKLTTLHGATWAPIGAFTLSIWPALLPFALAAAALAGLLVYDLSTRGSLSRGFMAFLERKAPAEGLSRDLFALFDGPTEGRDRWREADHDKVKSFVEGFKAASAETRAVLVRKAAEDAELWREKLVAAWLAESAWPSKKSDETRQAVLYNMAKAARRGTLPVSSVIERVLSRRSELAWLDHPSVLRPLAVLSAEFLDVRRPAALAALAALADHKDSRTAAAAREALPAPRPAFKPTRLGRQAAAAFLIGTLALSGVAGYKTVEFSQARQEAAQTALSIFYGEDLYIFTDQYADERINRDVLPVLKEWHATGKAPAAALAKALEVLRTSPDPKADNILETVFKRADLLPLTDASETLMLRTLIERDNDQVWRFLNEYMAQNGENPASAKRLVKMIQLGAEIGSEDVFRNLFHFLKSPNQQVKAAAAGAIRTSLMSPEKAGQFAERLKAVTAKHQSDPLINMWVAFFALDRLAGADASAVSVTSIDSVLSTALKAAAKADAARLGLIAQVKPGEEDKLPPPVMAQAFGLMDRSLDRAAQQGVNADPLALASRQQVDEAAKALVVEGVAAFPGLKERLIKDGVMAPDVPGSRYGGSEYDGYDDYHGHGGRFGGYYGGYSSPTPGYHDHYTKSQLAALAAAIQDEAAKAGASAKPEQREFADRALKVLEAAAPVAEKSGMPQGGTAAEAAASEMNQLLMDIHAKLPGTTALSEVRAAGLAPNANIGNDKDRSYRQSYTAEELVKLRALFSDILARGETRQDGKSFPLTWANKRFMAEAVDKADALIKKHYPDAAASLPADELGAPLADVSAAVAKGDAAALAKALKGLKAAYAKAPVKDVVLARFEAAYSPKAAGYKDEIRIQVLEFWLARLVADGAKLDVEGVQKVLDLVAPRLMEARVALKAYDKLSSALTAARTAGQDLAALRAFAESELAEGARRTLGGAKDALSADAYAALQARLAQDRVLIGDNILRAAIKPVHLRALAAALDASLTGPGEKAKTTKAWTSATVTSLLKVAAAAGIPDGGSVPELVADAANEALHKGDSVFPGHTWYDKLRAAGLAPAGKGTSWEKDLPSSYSPAQVRALHAYVSGILASGKGWDYSGKPSDLSAAQGRELAVMAERLDALMAKHYPKEAALTPAGLGRFVEGAAAGDAAARAGASARLAQAGSPAEVVALLDAASERVPGAAGQKVVADLIAEALAGRHGAALADKEEFLDFVTESFAKQGAAVESELYNRLAQTSAKAGSPTLKSFLLKAVNQRVNELTDQVEQADGAEERLIKAGLIRKEGYSTSTRESFTQRHLIGLQGVTAVVLRQKDLKEETRASAETASRVLPALLRAGDVAGMPAGDDPASIAGERIGALVAAGHQLFPGSRFIEELRAAKVVPNVPGASGFNLDRDVPIAWSKAEVVALRDFLKDILASGQGWDYSSGRRELTPEEKALLESTVKELDDIVAGYSALKAGPAVKSMNGFAMAGMALATAGSQSAPVVASLSGILLPVLALVAAASVIWAVARWFKASREADDADAAPLRTGPSEAVLARYKKLDLAAKKMASSLTEGKFRSRLIGAGGLTFAELANYQGEDVRAINWKASGKGDQLMVNRYEQEKDMPLLLLVDLSASGEFAAAGAEKRSVIEDAAALLALTAARRNIRVGALFFTDRVEAYVPPAGGERHAWEIVRRAMGTVPQGAKTDLRLALDFAQSQAKSRAMVVLLSDLVGEGWERSLTNLAGRHDFRAVRVVDPAEAKPLPDAGLVLARDPETGVERWIDTGSAKVREAMGAEVKARERRIEAALTAARTTPITLYTDEDAVDELSRTLLKTK